MARQIAVLNAGSSSIKFAVFDDKADMTLRFRGQVENIGVGPRLQVEDPSGKIIAREEWGAKQLDHRSATKIILQASIAALGGEDGVLDGLPRARTERWVGVIGVAGIGVVQIGRRDRIGQLLIAAGHQSDRHEQRARTAIHPHADSSTPLSLARKDRSDA